MLKRNGHSATFLKMKKLSHKSMCSHPTNNKLIVCTMVKVVEDVSTATQYAPSSNGIPFPRTFVQKPFFKSPVGINRNMYSH